MKKMSFGFVAVILAIGFVAFTSATKSNSFNCASSNLVWYEVALGSGDDIVATVNSAIGSEKSKLLLNTYPDLGSTSPRTIDQTVDFTTPARFLTESGAQDEFCPIEGDNKCAIAFEVDSTPDGEFEYDASFNIVPKTTAVVKCIVYRIPQ